jgi:hypothetical protein
MCYSQSEDVSKEDLAKFDYKLKYEGNFFFKIFFVYILEPCTLILTIFFIILVEF